jgi:hypothetical protein
MKNHDHLLEFAKKELALINFDQSKIHDTILKFLDQSSEICNNNADAMKQIANFLIRLIRGDTFDEIHKSRIPDAVIHLCRGKYLDKMDNIIKPEQYNNTTC